MGPLLADDADGQYEPGRAVARISVLNGDVSVRRGDSGDVVAAAVNAPLMADDRVLTSSSGRAEVQLDSANLVRVGSISEVRFVALDQKSFQLQIAAGTATFRVLRPSQAQVELDTPSVAVRPLREGVYRITVREDGTSEITVRSGEAEIDSQRGGERLEAGQTMNARGLASDPEFQIVQANPPDSWDRWNDDRDRYLQRSQAYQHVSPDISGAEDLDQYGQWTNDPTYGQVWTPNNEPAGWAPYQSGRWVWEDWYGWTWVSYDPWGWAPYHYGRWFHGAVGWSWYPGPIYARSYWAPAYVGFFGWGGGGLGVGFGFGGVGWVPLAPFEVFQPWWGRGFYGGFRNGFFGNHTTIVNNVNVGSVYRNARFAGGATGINAGEFGRSTRFTSLNQSQIQQAGLVHGVLPVSPDRSSLRLSDRSSSGSFPQARAQSFAEPDAGSEGRSCILRTAATRDAANLAVEFQRGLAPRRDLAVQAPVESSQSSRAMAGTALASRFTIAELALEPGLLRRQQDRSKDRSALRARGQRLVRRGRITRPARIIEAAEGRRCASARRSCNSERPAIKRRDMSSRPRARMNRHAALRVSAVPVAAAEAVTVAEVEAADIPVAVVTEAAIAKR